MAKRSKNKKKPVNKELAKKIRCLETDLKYTLRAIDGKHETLDVLFGTQAERIRAQIEKLQENQ